ncbi:hypothetical protein N303_15248, partial [Cuculus canorus]
WGWASPKSRVSRAVKGTWTSPRCPSKATSHAVRGCSVFSTTWRWTRYSPALAPPSQEMVVALVTPQVVPLKVKSGARSTPRTVAKILWSMAQRCSTSVASSKV